MKKLNAALARLKCFNSMNLKVICLPLKKMVMDYAKAIKHVNGFVRPIRFISRNFGTDEIIPGAGTLFFVNGEGVAITCKHITDLLKQVDPIQQKYQHFLQQKHTLNDTQSIQTLAQNMGYDAYTTAELLFTFVDCFDQIHGFQIIEHPTYDLAIIKFQGFNRISYQSAAVFPKSNDYVEAGNFFCRLGYPFPEFTNFYYDILTERMEWTSTGITLSPQFPIDGMVTRKINHPQTREEFGIELSRPGLRGQSGGPLFDEQGLVFGLQSMTSHLHLGFDILQKEEIIQGKKVQISNHPYLNLGICVNHVVIKEFLRNHHIPFFEN